MSDINKTYLLTFYLKIIFEVLKLIVKFNTIIFHHYNVFKPFKKIKIS